MKFEFMVFTTEENMSKHTETVTLTLEKMRLEDVMTFCILHLRLKSERLIVC